MTNQTTTGKKFQQSWSVDISHFNLIYTFILLRAASPKYQLDLEKAKKIEFLQTHPEWSPTATSYKNIVLSLMNQK